MSHALATLPLCSRMVGYWWQEVGTEPVFCRAPNFMIRGREPLILQAACPSHGYLLPQPYCGMERFLSLVGEAWLEIAQTVQSLRPKYTIPPRGRLGR